MNKVVCKHVDGWILDFEEYIIINLDDIFDNNSCNAKFICNTPGCGTKKRFKFDIVNIQEIRPKGVKQ